MADSDNNKLSEKLVDLKLYQISDSVIAKKKIEGQPNPLVSETAAENQAKFDALPKEIARCMNEGFAVADENFAAVSEYISEKDSGQSAALAAHIADGKHHVPTHEGNAEYKILGLKADGTAPEWKDYSKMVEERDKVISDAKNDLSETVSSARTEFAETVSAADAAFEADRNAFSAEMNEIKSETEQAKTEAENAANAAVSSVTAIASESEKKVKETADAVSKLAAETLIPVPNYEEDNEKCLKASYAETEDTLDVVSLSDHMRATDVAYAWNDGLSESIVLVPDSATPSLGLTFKEKTTVAGAAVLLFNFSGSAFTRIGSGTGFTAGGAFTAEELAAHSDLSGSNYVRFAIHNAVFSAGYSISDVNYVAVRLYPALPGADTVSYNPSTYNSGNDETGMYFKGDMTESVLSLADGTQIELGDTAVWFIADGVFEDNTFPCTVTRIVSPSDISAGTTSVLRRMRKMGWFDAKGYTDKFAVSKVTVNSSERVYLYDEEGLIQSAETLTVKILSTPSVPVSFYISTAVDFSVPADTESLFFNFKTGEAYKKSRTDSKQTRYTELDWLAGSETFKSYPGYLVYMKLEDESAAEVLYSYTAVASVQYAVSQKAGEFEANAYADNKADEALTAAKSYADTLDVIGSVQLSDIDNAKTSGIYKVFKDDELAGYLIVSSEFFVSQYYFQGIYDIRSLTDVSAVTIPIKFRYFQNNAWTAWKTLASMISESETKVKTYADTKDGENLEAAKEYAETKATAAETGANAYADTKDGENLSAAKDYADTKDGENLSAAKEYTDQRTLCDLSAKIGFAYSSEEMVGAAGGISYIKFYANGYSGVETSGSLQIVLQGVDAVSFSAPVGFGGEDYLEFGPDPDPDVDKSIRWYKSSSGVTETLSDSEFLNAMEEATDISFYDENAENTYADVTYTATVLTKVDNEIERAKAAESEALVSAKAYADTKAAAAEENAKTFGKQTFAGALKGEKMGGIVRLDDVSALDRRLDTVVSSKNMIPFPYSDGMSKTVNGVTFTVGEDGSITMNGTATADTQFKLAKDELTRPAENGETYVIKGLGGSAEYGKTYYLVQYIRDSDGLYITSKFAGAGDVAFAMPDEKQYFAICYIMVKSGTVLDSVVVKPQLERGNISTAYAKHLSDLSGVSVKKYGKNFFDCYGISANAIENPGASCALSNIHNTTIDKTALSSASDVLTVTQSAHPNETQKFSYTNGYFCIGLSNLLEGQAYTLSFDFTATDDPFSMMSNFTDTSVYALLNGSTRVYWKKVYKNRYSVSFTYTKKADSPLRRYIEFRLYGMSGTFSAFQLEPLSTASAYVPWSAPTTYTAGADGTVQNLSAYEDVTTLATDNEGAVLKTKYSRDLNAAFTEIQNAIIALGGSF